MSLGLNELNDHHIDSSTTDHIFHVLHVDIGLQVIFAAGIETTLVEAAIFEPTLDHWQRQVLRENISCEGQAL